MTKTVPQVPIAQESPDLERLLREAQARLAPPEEPRSWRRYATMRRLLPCDPDNTLGKALLGGALLPALFAVADALGWC